MQIIMLTQDQGKILGPVALLLGRIMNAIFNVLSGFGVENIGLTLIIFTLIVYLLMMPLTVKQQKFSKLQQRMSPELKAIQDKYKGKRDNASMMAQQEEIKALYGKYGVSQMGSCAQLLIQMPILFALYRVIYSIPAYVDKVKAVFVPLAEKLLETEGSDQVLATLTGATSMRQIGARLTDASFSLDPQNTFAVNTYIDVLNRSSTADWNLLSDTYGDLSGLIRTTYEQVSRMNNFLGINIGDAPSYFMRTGWSEKQFSLIFVAILIPLLAALTQWLNVKLMPQPQVSNDPDDPQAQMMGSMKTMNMMMPLMSAFFCFSFPAGVGLYWIAGSVIRTVQQVIINHHIDKMDLDAVIAKNEEKYKAKLEKQGDRTPHITQYATMNTRSMASYDEMVGRSKYTAEEKEEALRKAREYYESGKARPGSLLKAANMVRAYDEKNNR